MATLTIKEALRQRRQYKSAPTARIIATAVGFVLIYILIALLLGEEGNREYHFRSERGIITYLSAFFMATASFFASKTFTLSGADGLRSRIFWILAAVALGFFAIDEIAKIHENIGDLITQSSVGEPQVLRTWNDAIVIVYGVVGLIAVSVFIPEILRYPRFAEILAIGFLSYCIHTYIDSATTRTTSASYICEESAKLFSATFLALAMMITYRNKRLMPASSADSTPS